MAVVGGLCRPGVLCGAWLEEDRYSRRGGAGMSAQRQIICEGELLKRCRVSCGCAAKFS